MSGQTFGAGAAMGADSQSINDATQVTAGEGAPASSAPAGRRWWSRLIADAVTALGGNSSARRAERVRLVELTVALPRVLVEVFESFAEDASVAAGDRIQPASVLAGMMIRFMRESRNDLAEEQRLEALFADWLSGEIDITRTRRHLLNPKAGR
ncbi:MAG: hypothetical protein IT450_16795 [Phycisphaerales bacterium]|nr:hypothetical protein [Phycisphaerales bacterium]